MACSASCGPALREAVADDPTGPRFLALEWIETGAGTAWTDELLGRGLAALHAAGAPAFGGADDLVLGPLALPNSPAPSWPEFYATRRLEPLARMAYDRGTLPGGALGLLDRLTGCFAAYDEAEALAPGHQERVALWQVMPLLAHAALFGGGYGRSAVAAMRRYVS